MSSLNKKVNSNSEALRLIKDPTRLLYLLYTKYGDIDEDYNILITNQILYNKFTHINSIYKENIFQNNIKEFLRRFYKKKETKERIPKLYDYYKNYYNYFCRPFLLNGLLENLLHNYYNNKAEIFYKNNYSCSAEKKDDQNKKKQSNYISSLDNDTQNNIIFDKKNKYIIDNDIETNKYSITLNFDNSKKNIKGILTIGNNSDSSDIYLQNFIKELEFDEKRKNKELALDKENNKINNNKKINYELKENKKHNYNQNEDKNNGEKIEYNNLNYYNDIIINKSIDNKDEMNKTGSDIVKEIKNNNKKLALKLSRNISKLEDLRKNNNILNMQQNILNEFSSNRSKNNTKNNKENQNNNKEDNKKDINKNDNNNYLILKKESNKKNKTSIKKVGKRNNPKNEYDLKFKDFLTLKSTKHNSQKNHIKIFKLVKNQNNKLNKQENNQAQAFLINKNSKDVVDIHVDIHGNNNDKIASKQFITIFHSGKKDKSNKKISISSFPFNKDNNNSKNIKIKNNKFINYNSESIPNKYNILFRNDINSKTSKASNKYSSLDSNYFLQENNENKKNLIINHKNNLSYFKNEYEKNDLLNSLKLLNSAQSSEKRNSDLIPKNFLFQNYNIGKMSSKRNINNYKINGINNLKNFLYLSRNKNKNSMKSFQSKSIPLSLSKSKSPSREFKIKNGINTLSFKTNIIENKNIYISNIKIKNNIYPKEKIEEIIKSSKIMNNSLGKNDKNNRNIFNLFGQDFRNGFFSPINLKKNFHLNKDNKI